MHDLRTGRLGLLLDQLDRAREFAHARLEGLTSPAGLPEGAPLDPRRGSGPLGDEEYLWEPAPGAGVLAQTVRPRGVAARRRLGRSQPDPDHHDRLAAGAPAR
jgi:hypothetical protein